MKSSTVLGRSWNFQYLRETLKGATIAVPFSFTVRVEKPIDPLSGMTVNLAVVDRWWANVQKLSEKKWRNPFDFLTSAKAMLIPLWKAENVGRWEISLSSYDGRFWLLDQSGPKWKTPVTYFEKIGEVRRIRHALLTSLQEVTRGDLQRIPVMMSSMDVEGWKPIFKSFSKIRRIEVMNFSNTAKEFEVTI